MLGDRPPAKCKAIPCIWLIGLWTTWEVPLTWEASAELDWVHPSVSSCGSGGLVPVDLGQHGSPLWDVSFLAGWPGLVPMAVMGVQECACTTGTASRNTTSLLPYFSGKASEEASPDSLMSRASKSDDKAAIQQSEHKGGHSDGSLWFRGMEAKGKGGQLGIVHPSRWEAKGRSFTEKCHMSGVS